MLSSIFHLFVVRCQEYSVDSNLRRGQRWGGDKLKGRVTDKLPGQPQKGLLEVVVRLGGNVVILEIFLAVESDGLGFDLAFLHVDFVSSKDDRDVLADSNKVT